MKPKICIGTAQFGLDYGIINSKGKVKAAEAKKILEFGSNNSINLIDTAQSYGEAEKVVGKYLKTNSNYKVISKLSPQGEKKWDDSQKIVWQENFDSTLKRLQVDQLEGYLLHQSSDLIREDNEVLLDWLISLKNKSLINKIGVSIYTSDELDKLPLNELQIVQLPLSLYDQRMISNGTIKKLSNKGIEVHVRSIFLQGLLLQATYKWPNFLSKDFKNHHDLLNKKAKSCGISLLNLNIEFIKNCKGIESFLVGVNTLSELKEIHKAYQYPDSSIQSFLKSKKAWAWKKVEDLDPREWIKYIINK